MKTGFPDRPSTSTRAEVLLLLFESVESGLPLDRALQHVDKTGAEVLVMVMGRLGRLLSFGSMKTGFPNRPSASTRAEVLL